MKKKSPYPTIVFVLMLGIVIYLIILMVDVLLGLAGEGVDKGFLVLPVVVMVGSLLVKIVTAKRPNSSPQKADDPRTETFTKPDAPCIVCENTEEDHMVRDKATRIKQLDEWLKSGLIDRAEYRVLKDRYERDL